MIFYTKYINNDTFELSENVIRFTSFMVWTKIETAHELDGLIEYLRSRKIDATINTDASWLSICFDPIDSTDEVYIRMIAD